MTTTATRAVFLQPKIGLCWFDQHHRHDDFPIGYTDASQKPAMAIECCNMFVLYALDKIITSTLYNIKTCNCVVRLRIQ